ncbi:MAG: 50S ribosomal protein L4 [Candidatus Anoxychlamydiales bacterium]|nr:50S ribosomal protein L4 [Candidatus Anoxychlamydiales bacterium]
MATLKKYDIEGKEIGEVSIDDKNLKKVKNPQMIKDYLVALRNNARQWSANTKGRKEVNRTGAKPHRQKGLGRARQGSFAAPQYKGGGIVFGPKPKFDQKVKVNKKERKAAIRSLMVEKISQNSACVLKFLDDKVDKTKKVAKFFETLKLIDKRVLVLGKLESFKNLKRCMRNIPKKSLVDIAALNGYDLALSSNLIIIDSAFDDINSILTKSEKK